MGRYIIKIKDYYLEWSTVVDAPVTFGMTLDDFKNYYRDEYGNHKFNELNERLKRVHKTGTSRIDKTSVEEIISGNRAGPDESELTIDEIYIAYCLQKPIRDNWTA